MNFTLVNIAVSLAVGAYCSFVLEEYWWKGLPLYIIGLLMGILIESGAFE